MMELCEQCYLRELASCDACGVSICPECDGGPLCRRCDERGWNERLDDLYGPDDHEWTRAEYNAYLAESVRLAEAERERAEDEDESLVVEGQVAG